VIDEIVPDHGSDPVARALARTPARLVVGRAGPAYRTTTWLQLRADHAVARDAIHATVDIRRDFGRDRIERFRLFEVSTRAGSRAEYFVRPDLGRRLDDSARVLLTEQCPRDADLQVLFGDGLSAEAVATQAPSLLDALQQLSESRGWWFGRPFFVRNCRVGVLNDVGELLAPVVAVLLIGERPGLTAADSLSAYMAYRPCARQTDAQRNLISNIHSRGVGINEAAQRITALADLMRQVGRSGFDVKENWAPPSPVL
jgi:ethanolamine ammonia-lyase small subunit